MPSFQDSAFLILLALLLFGPKGLAKLARELGKLMGEFRRASNEFRLQMEDEFRMTEQAEQQKKIEAMEAAAPVAPQYPADLPDPEHPHMPAPMLEGSAAEILDTPHLAETHPAATEPLPIATAGELSMMPPATGLPVARTSSASALGPIFDAIPKAPAPTETVHNG